MRFKSKKLAALIASGVMILNATSCSGRTIQGYRTQATKSEKYNAEEVYKSEEERILSALDYDKFRDDLQKAFETGSVELDEAADKFVSSIYIDGTSVKVVLTDGSEVSGELQNIGLGKLNLENFHVVDSQLTKELYDETYGGYKELCEAYSTHQKLHVYFLNSEEVTVHSELKVLEDPNIDVEGFSWEYDIDMSECKSMWLDNANIFSTTLNYINKASALKRLILTSSSLIGDEVEKEIKLDLPELETFILEINVRDKLYSIDLTNCKKLERISLGNNTELEDLNFLAGLESLKVLSFGNLPTNNLDALRSFEEEENSLCETFETDDKRIAKGGNNNLIHDISGINGLGIEVLNISLLYHISSEELYETVKTLPNLREIIGFEINSAEMCSEELIKYCEEHNIKHPFTEKSLAIKSELKRIVRELITPDMNDFEKAKALSIYIIEHVEYDYDLIDEENETPETVRKGWGENLYYTVMEGSGVCAGYAEFTQALFKEAGIECYNQETIGHAYNLVEIDGQYYQIDLTNLDSWLNALQFPIEYFDFQINSICYMIPVGTEKSLASYSEPYKSTMQRKANLQSSLDELLGEEYTVYSDNEQIQSDITNNKVKSNNQKLISILLANGIAKRVTEGKALNISKQFTLTDNKVSPFWSKEDYGKFYESYIEQENLREIEEER